MKLNAIQEKQITVHVEPSEVVQELLDHYGFDNIVSIDTTPVPDGYKVVYYDENAQIPVLMRMNPLKAEMCSTLLHLKHLIKSV